MHALVSVHDVMPSVLHKIAAILQLIQAEHRSAVTLLVVPGLDWQAHQLDYLRHWQTQGFELAGHGWTHQAKHIHSFYHRFHSLLLSRRAAEHLCLNKQQLKTLIQTNYNWFAKHKLEPPQLYVPPAWALGALTKDDLEQLPFQYYESTAGFYDVAKRQLVRLPLAGFEADTQWRKVFLMLWNKANRHISNGARPLRISIHPHDLSYLLGNEIPKILSNISVWRHYQSV